MKMKSSSLRYHTWKDIGGPVGLLLDGLFFIFVLVSAACMLAFCFLILVLDYMFSPIVALMSRTHFRPSE
jgi:hypothetical protein